MKFKCHNSKKSFTFPLPVNKFSSSSKIQHSIENEIHQLKYIPPILDDEENLEHDAFFNSILPEVCNLALRLPFVITAPIPLLRRGCNQSLTFSQHQIASLLANAFFCTFPRRNATGRQTEYSNFPIINFNRLFGNREDTNGEKLSCLINYFRRVTQGQPPKGLVTFTRRSLSPTQIPDWSLSTKTLRKLKITSTGTIEDDGIGMLQVI